MFYCNQCAEKNNWPESHFSKSFGACEVCGRSALCNDVGSVDLPIPKRNRKGRKVRRGRK